MSVISTMTAVSVDNDSLTATETMNTTTNASAATMDSIRDEDLALIEVATLGTLFVLIFFGNCCVLLALALRPLKMTRMYYFLLHLCISDLITGFFTVLPQLAWDITYRFNGGNVLCKAVKFMQILGPYLSSYVLVVTAIDRYQAICFPLSNCSWTPRRSKLMISFAWLVAIICCLPQAFIFSYQEIPGTSGIYDCWGTFPQPYGERIYVTWYAVSVFFVPLIVLVFTHFYICREIWVNVSLKRKTDKREKPVDNRYKPAIGGGGGGQQKRYTAFRSGRKCLLIGIDRALSLAKRGRKAQASDCCARSSPDDESGRSAESLAKHTVVTFQESHSSSPRVNTVNRLSRAKIKTVKITVVVIFCYIVCSSPFISIQLWAYWVPSAQNSAFWTGPIITILMLLSSLNSFVNPFIYLFFNQNLVRSLLHCCCRVKYPDPLIKANQSEHSNYNENRIDTQSSIEDDSLRVHRNGTAIALRHDSDPASSPWRTGSRIRHQFRARRQASVQAKNEPDLDSSYDSMAVNV